MIAACVCRFKPVHLVHQAMLEALCDGADLVKIGIGSPNRYDERNPFSPGETAAMIRAALPGRSNYELIEVPDLGHGPRWAAQITQLLGPVDVFVTANAYVAQLLEPVYARVEHPLAWIPPERRAPIDGTRVRRAIALDLPWQHLVPLEVADYLLSHDLPERFRLEFGLAFRHDPVPASAVATNDSGGERCMDGVTTTPTGVTRRDTASLARPRPARPDARPPRSASNEAVGST